MDQIDSDLILYATKCDLNLKRDSKSEFNRWLLLQIAHFDLINFFATTESGEIIPPIASDTDQTDSISVTVSNKDSVPFNSDTDFANFQLGEFGVTQRNFVFHLTHKRDPSDSYLVFSMRHSPRVNNQETVSLSCDLYLIFWRSHFSSSHSHEIMKFKQKHDSKLCYLSKSQMSFVNEILIC